MQITFSFPQLSFKVCNKCNTEKPISEFNNCRERKDGKFGSCRACVKANFKPKTKEQARLHTANYRKNHPEKVKKTFKNYYDKNSRIIMDKRKDVLKTEEGREKQRKTLERHKQKFNETRRKRRKNMPPKQKVEKSLRDRFSKVIIRMKKGVKLCSWRDLIGCTVLEAKEHIEKQFVEGMNWGNHGNGHGKWNIDHIKPLYTFNLFDIEQQKEAFHFTNTRPLWFVDNIARNKGIKKGKGSQH